MNKINCSTNPSTVFGDLSTGTIFFDDGDFFIKLNSDAIRDNLDLDCVCNEGEIDECPATIDPDSVPTAIRLSDGLAMYFEKRRVVGVVFNNATISIE